MSDGVRVLVDVEGVDKRGAESAERDRRGATSSGGPSERLQ